MAKRKSATTRARAALALSHERRHLLWSLSAESALAAVFDLVAETRAIAQRCLPLHHHCHHRVTAKQLLLPCFRGTAKVAYELPPRCYKAWKSKTDL